jgi:hypothetical protein
MKRSNHFMTIDMCATAVALVALTGTVMMTSTPPAAWAQENSSSSLTGISLPKGASRVTSGSLPSGMGRLMAAGAKEFKLPEPQNPSSKAEVYFWTGSSYKEGRGRFVLTQLQSALTEAGYTITSVDPSVENTPNIFDEEAYGTGELDLGLADPRVVFFHATNVEKKQTIVGMFLDQQSGSPQSF